MRGEGILLSALYSCILFTLFASADCIYNFKRCFQSEEEIKSTLPAEASSEDPAGSGATAQAATES